MTMWHSPSAVYALRVGFLVCGRFPGLAAHINTHYRRHDPQTVLVILLTTGWYTPALLKFYCSLLVGLAKAGTLALVPGLIV